jgi:integrase
MAPPAQLTAEAIGHRLRIAATGMRVSGVVRLRWRDFDFDRRLLQLPKP